MDNLVFPMSPKSLTEEVSTGFGLIWPPLALAGEQTSCLNGVSNPPTTSSGTETVLSDDTNPDGIHGGASNHRKSQELTHDVNIASGSDPNNSPFEDSDESDNDELETARRTNDSTLPDFTSCILRELDFTNVQTSEDVQKLSEMDHTYSRPNSQNAQCNPNVATIEVDPEQQTRLVVRLPKSVNFTDAVDISSKESPRRRDRLNSSSSSTDTSIGVSTKSTFLDAAVIREELMIKRKVMRSEILWRKMQRISMKGSAICPNELAEREKVPFIKKLASHFRKNDFSKEPLNRSILNTLAEWLSPLPNGKLPPSKLRDAIIDLINSFAVTTPALVFQTSSIEGVLILLMNHPKESQRNKKLEWCIVNSWRDD